MSTENEIWFEFNSVDPAGIEPATWRITALFQLGYNFIYMTLAEVIVDWGILIETERFILRSLGRNKEPGEGISTTGLYCFVQKRGALVGKPELQPHDLRRTYTELGRRAGVPISLISKLLGHANIETTQDYLNIGLDLEMTISDFVTF